MPYHLDFSKLKLDFLLKRLAEEDLIPSQIPLREGLTEKCESLTAAGIRTLSDLEGRLKKDKSMKRLSEETGIPLEYLKLLGRALRGYRPKTAPLESYPMVDKEVVAALFRHGIKDSAALWEAASRAKDRRNLAAETSLGEAELSTLLSLADLSRIQWVSPLFSRLILEAGFRSVKEVAGARAEDLMEGVLTVNQRKKLFKGKIGLRDMGRLCYLASLLPHEMEP